MMTTKVALSAKLKGSNWIGMTIVVGLSWFGKDQVMSSVRRLLVFVV